MSYDSFLKSKIVIAPESGFDVSVENIHPALLPHQKDAVAWTNFNSPAQLFKFDNRTGSKIHPTQKPVALYEWILSKYAKEGYRILDTHLGSGSSRIAAYNLGFDFVGCEIDKEYFDKQEERFQAFTDQLRIF